MNRATWKLWYRQLRIIRRENTKAFMDAVVYGTGIVEIGENVPDLIRQVPLETVYYGGDPMPITGARFFMPTRSYDA